MITNYPLDTQFTNKNVAIISANIGNYDVEKSNILNIKNNDLFDWYYFTDSTLHFAIDDGWNIIKSTDFLDAYKLDNNALRAKYFKLQSHKINILSKYDCIIWMDASIQITNINFVNDILKILHLHDNNIYIFEHFMRNNIKDEGNVLKKIKKIL
jgi:hypothetical protein